MYICFIKILHYYILLYYTVIFLYVLEHRIISLATNFNVKLSLNEL